MVIVRQPVTGRLGLGAHLRLIGGDREVESELVRSSEVANSYGTEPPVGYPSGCQAAGWNNNPKPFVWHKTADESRETLAAYCQRISDSHSRPLRTEVVNVAVTIDNPGLAVWIDGDIVRRAYCHATSRGPTQSAPLTHKISVTCRRCSCASTRRP
jgi:hypothetical protein